MAGRKLKALEDEIEALRDELEKGRARNDGQVCGSLEKRRPGCRRVYQTQQ